jgi:hypothetical protein
MARARRVSLFEREIRIRLSSAAVEILLQLGSVLSEGQVEEDCFFGSTMLTIDLGRAAHLVSDACGVATARRVCDLIAQDDRFRRRAKRLALAEALRSAGKPLTDVQIDVRVRRNGTQLQLDMDVEANVEEES